MREIEVFLASPGDLTDERALVARVAEQVVQMAGVNLGLRVRVTGWEQVPPEAGRPQELINPLVDSCDVFVGLVYRRWGTDTGTHSSGFLEEFERALARRRTTENTPAIALYFKRLPEAELGDAGPQLSQVIAFRRRVHEERLALTAEFDSLQDLERQFTAYLVNRLTRDASLTEVPAAPSGSETDTDASPTREESGETASDAAQAQLRAMLDPFRRLLSRREPEGPLDGDRLLLFSLALYGDVLVPAHAANRLYRRRGELHLVHAEAVHWLRTLAAEYSSGGPADMVIPGWAVVIGAATNDQLVRMTSDADSRVARGAIRILKELGARPPEFWPASPDDMDAAVRRWTDLLAETGRSREGYAWLASAGDADDGSLLEAIAAASDASAQRQIRAFAAALTGDAQPAVDAAVATPAATEWLRPVLMAQIDSLDVENLQRLAEIEHSRYGQVRDAAFRAAVALGSATPVDYVAALMANEARDVDDVVNFLRNDPRVTELAPEVVAMLKARKGIGAADIRARVLALEEPATDLGSVSVLALDEWEAHLWRNGPEMLAAARSFLRSGLEGFKVSASEAADYFDENPEMAEFIYGRRAKVAAVMLSSAPPDEREPSDADLIRAEFERTDWYNRGEVGQALSRYGRATDAELLLQSASEAPLYRRTDLVGPALTLGGLEGARALAADDDLSLSEAGVRALASDTDVPAEELEPFLHHTAPQVRLAALRGLVQRTEREGLVALLDRYAAGSYYYNVVSGLDRVLFSPDALAGQALVERE